jgi:hypothetical protein
VLDYDEIDELDEINGDEQFVLIWCETHQTHEWHWVPRNEIPGRSLIQFPVDPYRISRSILIGFPGRSLQGVPSCVR